MSELMEEVLLLGRFDAGRMNFEPAPLDLRSLCTRVADEVRSTLDGTAGIRLRFDENLVEASADERLLRHIFTNLLSNAAKYSESASPVEFIIACDGRNAVCRVRDEGIGIPEADREWLFNAFHRGRNVGNRPGTGLGLVIVKRCVELRGGKIVIESKVGAGTTVTVLLPVFP